MKEHDIFQLMLTSLAEEIIGPVMVKGAIRSEFSFMHILQKLLLILFMYTKHPAPSKWWRQAFMVERREYEFR